jgi:hypothetical protein
VVDQRAAFGGAVADPLVLHEDDPAAGAREFKPVHVRDVFVGGDAVHLGQRPQP